MKPVLTVFGALQLLTAALLWLTPGFFYEQVGPFGPRNDHYMGDLATWYLALGALALVAVRRREWRGPVLVLAVLQNLLHAFNHLLDVGEADPGVARAGHADFARALERARCVDAEPDREAGAMKVFVAGASGAIGRSLVPHRLPQ